MAVLCEIVVHVVCLANLLINRFSLSLFTTGRSSAELFRLLRTVAVAVGWT